MCKTRETAVLKQSVTSSVNMLSQGADIEIIEARLQVAMEIAEGLGLDLSIPTTRKMIYRKFCHVLNRSISKL